MFLLSTLYFEQNSITRAAKQNRTTLNKSRSKLNKEAYVCMRRSISTGSDELQVLTSLDFEQHSMTPAASRADCRWRLPNGSWALGTRGASHDADDDTTPHTR